MAGVGYIRMGRHTKDRMYKRGYTKGDMVSAILKGNIVEIQFENNSFKYVIEGRDKSNNPIVVVLLEEGRYEFLVVTVMPPTDNKRFSDCI